MWTSYSKRMRNRESLGALKFTMEPLIAKSKCLVAFFVISYINQAIAEVLTPPYFNLAQGKRIHATATCGESADGQPEHEMYCNLVGSTTDTEEANLVHGQVCSYCEKGVEGHWHPPDYAIDGTERWWQSPPLSRGTKYNEVNLTIDLGQEFHVAYIILKMAHAPRPGVWVLERSADGGQTFTPWQYFADNPQECEHYFGSKSTARLEADDDIACDTKYSSIIPLQNADIIVRLLEGRPNEKHFFTSDVLQNFTRATHVRIRLVRTKTLLGHLMSLNRQDSSVTRRYFYAIKGIFIGGRCRCNGHAAVCDVSSPDDPYRFLCSCQHNTCGAQCETCCPGYVQKAWQPATNNTPFVCEPCNCHGHSNECEYDEETDRQKISLDINGMFDGGGVCQNCRHNTEGINCNRCKPGFFKPWGRALTDVDVCQPCNCYSHFHSGSCEDGTGKCECSPAFLSPNCEECNVGYYDYPNCRPCDCNYNGTRGGICEVGGDQCPCKQNYAGKNCDRCADGFYNFPECLACACESLGSVSPVCDPDSGQCECQNNFGLRQCNECENGYYNFPSCTYCNCDVQGTREGICDKGSGECLCREGYGGARCDQCLQGFYGYPSCAPCNCSSIGSSSTVCDSSGKCPCLENFGGRACEQCRPGYYQYPECLPCSCNEDGLMGVSCDDEGKCQCKSNFDGLRCEDCRSGFYNFPLCEECNCDPAGVKESFGGCADSPPGELCQCKERVEGRICNSCKPLYWNLQQWNPLGCEDCDCHGPGVLGGVRACESKTGQCTCKNFVGSRRCEECRDGFYNLTGGNYFGCQDCGCDVGGSMERICDKNSGQCNCRPRISGTQCKSPVQAHYYPTLFQYQYEAEDGRTPTGGEVRFGYDNSDFPDYSWRGYAIYSQLQPETQHSVDIEKPSLYMVVIRYTNPGSDAIMGEIRAVPDNPTQDEPQTFKVRFEPNEEFLRVGIGNLPTPLVLNPGRWQFSIKSDQYLLVDYFTLLPEAYYEGTVLAQSTEIPCRANTTSRNADSIIVPEGCTMYKFPSVEKLDSVPAVQGYVPSSLGDRLDITRFYSDKKVIDVLNINDERMATLTNQQQQLGVDLQVSKGGRYALLLEYFTPQGANLSEIQVKATSKKGETEGTALIHNCNYAFLCRQVVTTPDGEVAVFRFDSSSINILLKVIPTLENEEGTTHVDRIAINRIVAIPLGKWSLDQITPRQYCVIKDGSCVSSGFDLPPDYVKVEAEFGGYDRVAQDDDLPEGVSGKGLVLLDSQNRILDLSGRIPIPGYYNILVQYHQPDAPEFQSDVMIQDGQHYQAKIRFLHCPSTSGCRGQVSQEDKNTKFYIQDNFIVTIKSPRNVWLDYILLVPADPDPQRESTHLQKFLAQSPVDDTRRFLSECGRNNFNLPSNNISEFCRGAVFSITADYNNGALPCQCDYYGSTAFECEEYGGQCQCKDNVIGRRCERCRTGYYGFPDCKPCDCPSTALCDEATGACICPKNVIGDLCDNCAPLTYGFDALIGCEECNCSPLGVENGNLQCDQQTGSCTCKNNIVGKTCDRCLAGFWAFPYCQMCDCDVRGTTDEICNQDTATCFCKPNVEGRNCDQCTPGSFNLLETNPTGCTQCFCFGKTTRCTSSYMFWSQVSFGKKHWTAVAIDPVSRDPNKVETGYQVEFEQNEIFEEDEDTFVPVYIPEDTVPEQDDGHVLYFRLEIDANRLNSVGGRLQYLLLSEPDDSGQRDTFSGPDVIIEGKDLPPSSGTIRLLHYTIDHLDGENKLAMNLPLSEESFVVAGHTSGGGLVQATRDQLMIVMKGLKAIYIRAGYWKHTRESRLLNLNLDIATEDFTYADPEDRAVTVEQCQCPPNYQGLSCEECSPGYYRLTSGPMGGICVPCQCNGHSDVCDSVTGVCLDCKHNTTGDHCDMCVEGYHGDATVGTPYDCLICACPIPMASNNFATKCELSPDGRDISCTCKEGYIGNRCESCDSGYYGRPEYPGDYCKPCNCSGNIDPNDPSSCDTYTGACLKCLNNTGGPLCNICAAGFYGDALIRECRNCPCESCGTYECDNSNGECLCLNNVEGYLCDRCKPDHWGLGRCDGLGCRSCDCGIASISSQCDDMTGQCECRKGTTGFRCERCAPGYWNYSSDGCQPCECNTEYAIGVGCDPSNGQCSCLPGVIGEKCDHCPYRWVLIEDRGCQQCDSCHHQLLDVTDDLARQLDPVMNDFENKALSYFTTQKLAYFNDTVIKLKPSVSLLDPSKADLSEYYTMANDLEREAMTQRQKAELMQDSLVKKAKQSSKLRDKSVEVESKVQEAVAKATTTVFETKDLMEGLLKEDKPSSTPQSDAAKAEAEALIATMESVQFDPSPALEENATITTVLKDVKKFVRPLEKIQGDLRNTRESVMEAKDKLADIRNQSDHSISTSRRAKDIGNKIRDSRFSVKTDALKEKASGMIENAAIADELNRETPGIRDSLQSSYMDLDATVNSVKEQGETLGEMMQKLVDELGQNENTVADSQRHAQTLEREADTLEYHLGRTKSYAERAVTAATAYQKIEESLQDAIKAAEQAKDDSTNATAIIDGAHLLAKSVIEPSQNLLTLATESQRQVEIGLKIPLRDAKSNIAGIEAANNITSYSLGNFEKELEKITVPTDDADIVNAIRASRQATDKSDAAQSDVDQISEKLPGYSDRMKKVRVSVSDLNQATGISDSQLRHAKDSIPLSSAITGDLEEKKPIFDQKKNDIAEKLAELKAQIAAARERANRITIGVSTQDSSTLLLENPRSLESQQAQTRVSFYFKTEDDHGLVFYLGNEPGRKEEDFMAVEVEQGYPVLTVDLGSGPQRIMNEKYVRDNQWYKATIDRSGKTVRFGIAHEDAHGQVSESIKEEYLTGSKSLFNVDRNSSKLFIGGLPPGVVRSPVRYSTFRGAVEDLVIGDEKVGLWNFKDAQNIAPHEERDRFIELHRETGLRFQGNGYAILDRTKYPPIKDQSAIQFRFKTRSKNGLIFLVGKGRKFMSIHVSNGNVVFQYDLGSGRATLRTNKTYNDGQWHKVDTRRFGNRGRLIVDSTDTVEGESPGSQQLLSVGDYMYWGGYPGEHGYRDVTNKPFEGCLEEVEIEQVPVGLTEAVESRYTIAGCPSSQFAPTVATFTGQGYVQVDSADSPVSGPVVVSKDESFEINLRLRSNDTRGLVFYGSNGDQSNFVSVSMEDGALVVKTEPGTAEIRTDSIADGDWHVITVTRDRGKLTVNIDDDHEYVANAPGGPVQLNTPGSTMLFGGKPWQYNMRSDAAASTGSFSGCMADISLNGNRLDFSDSVIKDSTVGQKCFTADETEAMAQELGAPEANGLSIPKEEEEDGTGPIPDPEKHHYVQNETDYGGEVNKGNGWEDDVFKSSKEEDQDIRRIDDDVKPTPFQECRLPYREAPTEDLSETVNIEEGVMFGVHDKTCRIEFHQPRGDGVKSEYSIEFKTSYGDGLIFLWTTFDKTDYIALFLRKGMLHYAFDSGAGPAFLNSSVTYNDTKWHSVTVSRVEQVGDLFVDGQPVVSGRSSGSTTEVNAGSTVYVGGIPQDAWVRTNTKRKLLAIDSPFRGCLRNFRIRGAQPRATRKHSVQPCSETLERGMFFYPRAGYLKISDQFRVGRSIKLSMNIKPRHPSGILVAVHGDKDFMVLQLINGTVKFTVDSGKGVLSSSFQKETYDLCDGNWHTIRVTKSRNVVTLALDNYHSNPGIGQAGHLATNTNSPLYVGGHPDPSGIRGIETTEQYVGCIRDFVIENRQYKLNYDSIIGTVGLSACPKD